MIQSFREILAERAGEWKLPADRPWTFLLHNNYNPHCSTFNVMWFCGTERYPRVVTKVCREAPVIRSEFDRLQAAYRAIPAHVPRPLYCGQTGGFTTLWMAGVPGLRIPPRSAYPRESLSALVDMLVSIHRALRRPSGGDAAARYEAIAIEPLRAASEFGASKEVRNGCLALAQAASRNWVAKLPVIPQHGDLYLDNVIREGDELHVVDWEAFGMVDTPFFDLMTLLLSTMRMTGSTPDHWDAGMTGTMPALVSRYTAALELPLDTLTVLLPLSLVRAFHLQFLEGRKPQMEQMYRTLEHYFTHEARWQRVFLGGK
jgi:aminoglycoside phosphotransferase (APT) family kinase protein